MCPVLGERRVPCVSADVGEHVVIFRSCVFAVSKCFSFIDTVCGECVSSPIFLSALFGHPLFLFDLCLKINRLFSLTEQHFRLGAASTVCSLIEQRLSCFRSTWTKRSLKAFSMWGPRMV